MNAQINESLLPERLMATLSGFFGALAGLLAVIGLYGVMSYTVARRRNEIGIRMALGADRSTVVAMVMREAGALVGVGLAVGVALALVAGRAAGALLFGLPSVGSVDAGRRRGGAGGGRRGGELRAGAARGAARADRGAARRVAPRRAPRLRARDAGA